MLTDYLNKPVSKKENIFVWLLAVPLISAIFILGSIGLVFNSDCSSELLVDSFEWFRRLVCESSEGGLLVWAVWSLMTLATSMAVATIKSQKAYYVTITLAALQALYFLLTFIVYQYGKPTPLEGKVVFLLIVLASFYFLTVIYRKHNNRQRELICTR